MVWTDEGILIDRSDEQLPNANRPRFEIRPPASNVTLDNLLQLLKPQFAIASVDAGMQID
jgi:hypothetical protein